jgi:acetyl esterase/lipase
VTAPSAAAAGPGLGASSEHVIVLPGGGYAEHAANEGEPIAQWLQGFGVAASVFRYPLMARHPAPLSALRAEIRRVRAAGSKRIGVIGFSAGGHLAGHAALADGAAVDEAVDFAVLGYSITSMETETYRPARLILLGEDASPELRRATSLDGLVTTNAPPFFIWHTAEDPYVPVEHAYRLAASLAAHGVPHAVHVFAHGPHSLGLAIGAGEPAAWTELAKRWIQEQTEID